jgi:hypothetical protein
MPPRKSEKDKPPRKNKEDKRSEDARIRLLLKIHDRNWTTLNGTNMKKAKMCGGKDSPDEKLEIMKRGENDLNQFTTNINDDIFGNTYLIAKRQDSIGKVRLSVGSLLNIRPIIAMIPYVWKGGLGHNPNVPPPPIWDGKTKVVEISSILELDKLQFTSPQRASEGWAVSIPHFTKDLLNKCTVLRDKYLQILEKNRKIQKQGLLNAINNQIYEYTLKYVKWNTTNPSTVVDWKNAGDIWEDKDIPDTTLRKYIENAYLTIPRATQQNFSVFVTSGKFETHTDIVKQYDRASDKPKVVLYNMDDIVQAYRDWFPMAGIDDRTIGSYLQEYDTVNNLKCFVENKNEVTRAICEEFKKKLVEFSPQKSLNPDINKNNEPATPEEQRQTRTYLELISNPLNNADLGKITEKWDLDVQYMDERGAPIENTNPVVLSWNREQENNQIPKRTIDKGLVSTVDPKRNELAMKWYKNIYSSCFQESDEHKKLCSPETKKEIRDKAIADTKDLTLEQAIDLGYKNKADAILRYPDDVIDRYESVNSCLDREQQVNKTDNEFFKKLAQEDYRIMGGTPEKVIDNWRKFDLEYGQKWNKLDSEELPPTTISRELFLYYVAATRGQLGLYEYYLGEQEGDDSANTYAAKWKVQRIWGPHWKEITQGDSQDWDDQISKSRIALINSLISIGALPPSILEDYTSAEKSVAVRDFCDAIGSLSVELNSRLQNYDWVPKDIWNAIPEELRSTIVLSWRPGDALKTGVPIVDAFLEGGANAAYEGFFKGQIKNVIDSLRGRGGLTELQKKALEGKEYTLGNAIKGWFNPLDIEDWGVSESISTMFMEIGVQFFPTTANRKVSTLQKFMNVGKAGIQKLISKIAEKTIANVTEWYIRQEVNRAYSEKFLSMLEKYNQNITGKPASDLELRNSIMDFWVRGDKEAAFREFRRVGKIADDSEQAEAVLQDFNTWSQQEKIIQWEEKIFWPNKAKLARESEKIAIQMEKDSQITGFTDFLKFRWRMAKDGLKDWVDNQKKYLENSLAKGTSNEAVLLEERAAIAEAESAIGFMEAAEGAYAVISSWIIPVAIGIAIIAIAIFIIWDVAANGGKYLKDIFTIFANMTFAFYYWGIDVMDFLKNGFEAFWAWLTDWGLSREEFTTEYENLEDKLNDQDDIQQMLVVSHDNFKLTSAYERYLENPSQEVYDRYYTSFKNEREMWKKNWDIFLASGGRPCLDTEHGREIKNPQPCMGPATREGKGEAEINVIESGILWELPRWRKRRDAQSDFNTMVPEPGVPAPTFPPQPFDPPPRPPPTKPQPPLEITDDDIQKFLVPSEDNWKLSSSYDSKVQMEKKHPNENFDNMYRKQFDAARKRWNEMYPRYKALSEDEQKLNKNQELVMNYRQIINEARVWKKKILEQQEKDKNTQQNPPPSQPPPPSDQPAPFQGSGVGGRIKCRLYKMNAKGGASTALLTLTDTPGHPGAPGGAPGAPGAPISGRTISTSGQSAARRTDETVGSVKATIEAFQGLNNPKKAVVRDLASDLLDFYNTASPEARGALDDSFNIDGFINRLSKGANMTGKKAQKYFQDMSEAIGDMMLPVEKPYDEEADTGREDLVGLGMSGGCDCGGAEPKSSMPKLNFTKVVPSEPMPSEEKKLLTQGGIRPGFLNRIRKAVRRSMKGRGNAGNPLQAYQQEGGLERGKAENAADYEWNRVMEKARRFQRKDLNVSNARKLVDEPYYNTSYYNTLRTPNSAFGEWHGNGKSKRDAAEAMADMSEDIYGRDAERLHRYNRMAADSGVPPRTLYNVKDGHGRIVYKTRNLNDAQSKLFEVLQLELAMAKPEQGNKRIIDNQVRVMPEIVLTNLLPTQWLHSED